VATHVIESRTSTGQARSVAVKVAADAYIFGYPLVLMDATRRAMTTVRRPCGLRAPLNRFAHVRTVPDPTFTDVVRPSADMLYSTAWLDLSEEPVVLSVPEVVDRYYVMQLLDAWTNVFASLGSRTTGTAKRDFAIVGPRWSGRLPSAVQELRAPTNMVWLIGRTQTSGMSDYAAVHAIQNRYALRRLSAWGHREDLLEDGPCDPTGDVWATPVEQVANMDAGTFFGRVDALMVANPPSAVDALALERFASVGIFPHGAFTAGGLAQALAAGVSVARGRLIAAVAKQAGERVNGWTIPTSTTGRYGTDYLRRAVVALVGLGANLPEDAVYLHATTDADGQPLTGANKYAVQFAPGALPPVRAFWSVSMYNDRHTFADNVIDRYAIGDRDNLTFGGDGSLTLYIQRQSPGIERSSNWLPAGDGRFNLIMRLYRPTEVILSGAWAPPPVQRVR
jgi:hypothetical protein